jgi:aminoglycoside 6'-N-acetyltransferase
VALAFEPLAAGDLPLLGRWLARPHVQRWWREPSDPAAVEAAYGPLLDGTDPTEGYVVVLDGRPVGFVQRYRVDAHPGWAATVSAALGDPRGVGIDYLIGEEDLVGQGLGRRMIARFSDDCWSRYPDDDRIVVAVQQGNVASWRALEAAGFGRVWDGRLATSEPSDEGPAYLYVLDRPPPAARAARAARDD